MANASLRALLVALDEWVSAGKEPPAIRVPRIADGTLVPSFPQSVMGFPNIPGVTYNGLMSTGDRFDYGPGFEQGILAVSIAGGPMRQPEHIQSCGKAGLGEWDVAKIDFRRSRANASVQMADTSL